MTMSAPDYRLLTNFLRRQSWCNLSNVLDITSIVIYSETSVKRTPSRVPKLTSYRITVIRDQSSPKSLSQNTAQFPNSVLNNMELYHSTEQPLNVNRSQTLRNFCNPLLSGHLGRSRRCPLNRGFTVAGARSLWLLPGHMTSNNETVSCKNL